MEHGYFSHDCTKCEWLCCISTLRGGELFASNDPVGKACRHLMGNFRCAIHEKLNAKWFPWCASYRCHSAGNRLTRILRIANIPDIRKSLTPRQRDIARVVQEIFKDIEWTMSILESLEREAPEKFIEFQSQVETYLEQLEEAVRKEGNIYVMIPKSVELYANVRDEKKRIFDKQGAPLALSRMARHDTEASWALKWVSVFPQADIPQQEFDHVMQDMGHDIPHPEQLRKFLFAAYQFGWSFYGNPTLWAWVSLEEAIGIADQAAQIYADYSDSEEWFDTREILTLIFGKCSRTQFVPI